MDEERMWNVVAAVAGLGVTLAIRRIISTTWARQRGGDPPTNPADDETTWKAALTFAVISGTAVGLARIVSDRLAAEAWRKARGAYPPGIKHGVTKVAEGARNAARAQS